MAVAEELVAMVGQLNAFFVRAATAGAADPVVQQGGGWRLRPDHGGVVAA